MSIKKFIKNIYDEISQNYNNDEYTPSIYELYSNGDWDPLLLGIQSNYPKPNAFIFGLIINDWDQSLRSRNPLIKTNDLEIPFQIIETIPNWDKSANYDDIGSEILGRFESYAVYTKSQAQEFSLTLYYSAYARDNINTTSFWTLENIEMLEKRLQSLVFPMYVNGFSPPPKVLLNIGNIFYNFPVVVKQVNIEYQPPYDYLTGLSINRKIILNLRSAYPAWQAISGDKIYMGKSKKSAGNHLFAYKKIKNSLFETNKQRWYK